MKLIDFENRKNRLVRLNEVKPEYLDYISNLAKNSKYYPKYHLAPKHGLMNDPNGLIQINGEYHIFYQWFPLGPVHGLKHWYHVKTKDFINYDDLDIAMYPDCELDIDGCYTGVMVKENDKFVIYYTGITKDKQQQVCTALFDGKKITDKKLCVAYDNKITDVEFRDPCLYDDYLFVGAKDIVGDGIIIVFKRKNNDFKFKCTIKLPIESYMLECPSLVRLDENTDLLIVSPQGIQSTDKYTYRNVFSVCYAIGKFDKESIKFDTDRCLELDKGFDFYAPQLFRDEKNRLVMLAWLGNSKCVYPSDFEQWAHMMTLPREIKYINGELYQMPLDNLINLREHKTDIHDNMTLESQSFELEFETDTNFKLEFLNNKGESLSFSGNSEEYCLDRSKNTYLYNEKYGFERYAKRDLKSRKIRMYVDTSAVEIFAEDGKITFTARFYVDDFYKLKCTGIKGNLYQIKHIKYK